LFPGIYNFLNKPELMFSKVRLSTPENINLLLQQL